VVLFAELAERQRIDGAFKMKVQFGLWQSADEVRGHGIIVCKGTAARRGLGKPSCKRISFITLLERKAAHGCTRIEG
jgi:hypothetical protein